MKNDHDFRELVDRRLSGLDWNAQKQQRVLRALDEEEKPMKKKISTAVVLALAALLTLSATALAAAWHNGFFHNAFGTGVQGQEAYDVEDAGEGEGLAKTEHYPTIEREDVDEEKAEALVGAYVADIGKSVALKNYTFTLESALLDENGVGALTVRVENPDGHGLQRRAADYTDEAPEPFFCVIHRAAGDFPHMDDHMEIVSDAFTETEATLVYYVTPFAPLPADEALTLELVLNEPDVDPEDLPAATLELPGGDRLPARRFQADGATCQVSPVGMALTYGFNTNEEAIEDSIVIHYADGSDYVVKGEDVINMSVSSLSADLSTTWIAFNRLADADAISGIGISGSCGDERFELLLTPTGD